MESVSLEEEANILPPCTAAWGVKTGLPTLGLQLPPISHMAVVRSGSAQLLFRNISSVVMYPCNTTAILPCFVTNLKDHNVKRMFVKWKLNGKEFFSFDGDGKVTKNATFSTAELQDQSKVPDGDASLKLSIEEAKSGNYSCEVVESNREGDRIVELTYETSSAQLLFRNISSVVMHPCNTTAILPCFVTNLKDHNVKRMCLKWKLNGKEFFSFDGDGKVTKNATFSTAELQDQSKVPDGDASLKLSIKEAKSGNYSCEVVESNREGDRIVELTYETKIWLEPWESTFIVVTIILAVLFYWIQFIIVAKKFDMTFLKKISLSCAGLIVTVAAVAGCFLLVPKGYSLSNRLGFSLIILPAVILVPLLFVLLGSVFEKLPRFAIILVALKAIGYIIALIGFIISLSGCLRKETTVVVVGLLIIDVVAAVGVIYVFIFGSNLKDHQPPRLLMQGNRI
ncbi:leukocyte surface antigen CD47 isoform X2 [Hemicordylus capensis]|uniref:leukocyte surface antigen CD47 isoform X2 n=1 Tax=Hemicordylus capensis TaxID=884348 RepID=UPI002304AA98|nr:leukocyte surface antigen CD47 isoform X2 [Hemicordylus capensis]